jgi:hypothetical protein
MAGVAAAGHYLMSNRRSREESISINITVIKTTIEI